MSRRDRDLALRWVREARDRGWFVFVIAVAFCLVAVTALPVPARLTLGLVGGTVLLRLCNWEAKSPRNAERGRRTLVVITGWWCSALGAMTMLASFTLAPNWFGVVALFLIGTGFFVTGLPAAREALGIVLRRR